MNEYILMNKTLHLMNKKLVWWMKFFIDGSIFCWWILTPKTNHTALLMFNDIVGAKIPLIFLLYDYEKQCGPNIKIWEL